MKNKKGFTLIETLVAILLFVLALSALLFLVQNSITSANYNKNEIVATYLAQEGVDYIRNLRDQMVHVAPSGASPWQDFVDEISLDANSGCAMGTGKIGCHLDLDSLNPRKLSQCLPSGCDIITISNKPFRRTISTMSMGTDALLVKVEVTWYNGSTLRNRTLTTSLYNWAI